MRRTSCYSARTADRFSHMSAHLPQRELLASASTLHRPVSEPHHRHCSGAENRPSGAPVLGPPAPRGFPPSAGLGFPATWPCPSFQAAPRATGTETAELQVPGEAWRGAPRGSPSRGRPVTGHCWTSQHRQNGRLARWCFEILIALECKVLWGRVQFVGVNVKLTHFRGEHSVWQVRAVQGPSCVQRKPYL